MRGLTENLARVMSPGPRGGAPVQLTVEIEWLDKTPHHVVQAVHFPVGLRRCYARVTKATTGPGVLTPYFFVLEESQSLFLVIELGNIAPP